MSFDLQSTPQVIAVNPAMARQHAIYLEAQRSDRKVHKARNVADLLERGHRSSKSNSFSALLVDVMA